MSRYLVIYNPIAGRGRVQKHWPEVEQGLIEAGVEFDVAKTSAPLDAVSLAEKASEKYSAVIAVGGDGTVHEVVNGLLRASSEGETIPLGVIPLGNGDDFAKVIPPETQIGGKVFDWRVAVDKIAKGQAKLFDVGRLTGEQSGEDPQYFMNGMDIGFGAQAALNFTTVPSFLTGMAAYLAAIMKTLIDYRIPKVKIQIDDQPPFEQSTTMTVVTNGRCFGSGFWVCPDAQVDDGLLNVMVADGIGRVQILGLIPKIMKGTHVNEPILKNFLAKRVVISADEPFAVEADGEVPYPQTTRLEVQVLERKLRVII
ncbi:MAG TPA: diacylglycerol kinase family lipid kinase [Candidatus Thioglobus sp.]|jgi:YegS/Rv2252/BmrU family lipid kinase|nr:diacylglycerol kinase family lipid kinase [Candidatus Thioglobus sp.]HIL20141.1 diacylglycerol kinase family lipid kinase [Candidatus Thioglobus sp.]